MANKLRTHARIKVTIEVAGSAYGPEWTVGAIAEQANKECLAMLRSKLEGTGLKIVGEPKTTVLMAEEE
jgi:hypothetical protein